MKISGVLQSGQAGSMGTGLWAAVPVKWDIPALSGVLIFSQTWVEGVGRHFCFIMI